MDPGFHGYVGGGRPREEPAIDHLTIPPDLALVRVENSLEGTIAYAVELDGVPLGLLVNYVYELPVAWYAYARPTREGRLASLPGSPFARPQDAMDAVDRAIMQQAVKAVAA